MSQGRYYPSQTELADGRTLDLAGYTDEAPGGVDNTDLDVFSPVAGSDQLDHPGLVVLSHGHLARSTVTERPLFPVNQGRTHGHAPVPQGTPTFWVRPARFELTTF